MFIRWPFDRASVIAILFHGVPRKRLSGFTSFRPRPGMTLPLILKHRKKKMTQIAAILRRGGPATEFALAAGLVTIDVVARLLPHAANFAPLAASALFAGVILRSRRLALGVPIAALLASDLLLGGYDWRVMSVVYAGLMVPVLLGTWGRRMPAMIVPLAVASSLVFFASSNFAVWAFGAMYPTNAAGLVQCYAAALPFLHTTLLGDLFWTAVLFGGWRLASGAWTVPSLRRSAWA